MAQLDAPQQLFLQGFLWKKICHYFDVCKLYNACHDQETEVPVDPADLQRLVNKINRAIEPMHMRICKGVDEVTEDNYYALVNTADNSLSRLSSDYSANELELFKKIVACIVDSDDGKVDSVSVLNLADELERRTSKKEADEVVNKFSRDKWLIEQNGCISLSTRSILELDPYLRSTYKDSIYSCICKAFVFQHVACRHCGFRFHRHCATKYFADHSMCPQCEKPWTEG